jgi:hypothetical protein
MFQFLIGFAIVYIGLLVNPIQLTINDGKNYWYMLLSYGLVSMGMIIINKL